MNMQAVNFSEAGWTNQLAGQPALTQLTKHTHNTHTLSGNADTLEVFIKTSGVASVTNLTRTRKYKKRDGEDHVDFVPPSQPALIRPRIWVWRWDSDSSSPLGEYFSLLCCPLPPSCLTSLLEVVILGWSAPRQPKIQSGLGLNI